MVATTNQNLLWDNLTQSPENDPPLDNSPTETSTQTMVHEYLSDGGMDPSDINNVMSAFKAKAGKPPQRNIKKSTPIKHLFLLEQINLPIIWLIGELMEA